MAIGVKAAFVLLVVMAAATHGAGPADPVQAAAAVLGRVIPTHASNFHLHLWPSAPPHASGLRHAKDDAFRVEASGSGEVHVYGTSAVALCSGAYWYLKNVTGCQVTWGVNGTGDQLRLPATLPRVRTTQHNTSVPWRYAWNVVTFSYSGVWWDWARWERELDWMALHGINLPLAYTGLEYIWLKVYTDMGLTLEDLQAWFTGPAFLSWQRMGNIRGFAGPLTEDWITSRAALQKKIVARAYELGMTPVLPCFGGHVPYAIRKVYPNASLISSGSWNNFPHKYSDDLYLEPTDPLYRTLGRKFIQEVRKEYGGDHSHYYSCDTFNEVAPRSSNHAYLHNASKAVMDAIEDGDPKGVWVMQAWLFHGFVDGGFWTPDRVRAYLGGVSPKSLLILDLNSEVGALAPQFDQYYGHAWVWNLLLNYGGVRGMYGNLSLVASDPVKQLNRPGSTMCGMGFTPEAIEQNPVMYELLTEMFWTKTPIDSKSWLSGYVTQRYGQALPMAQEAWEGLVAAVYNQNGEPRSEIHNIPHPTQNFGIKDGSATKMFRAFEALLQASRSLPNAGTNGPFQYDFVDVTRQAGTMFFSDVHRTMANTFLQWQYGARNNSAAFARIGAHALKIIATLDDLLCTNPNYLLGHWIKDAARWGNTTATRQNMVYNAKNQVTLWGHTGEITDYAAKAWCGLYGDYYYNRWKLMIDTIVREGALNWDYQPWSLKLLAWEQKWCTNFTQEFRATPSGKSSQQVAEALEALISVPQVTYNVQRNMDIVGNNEPHSYMWTRDVRQLQVLCDLDPECLAFTSAGVLKTTQRITIHHMPGVDVYMKPK